MDIVLYVVEAKIFSFVQAYGSFLDGLSLTEISDGLVGLGIGSNFMIDNQLQPTDRLSIIISSSHFCSNWVLKV